jgi:hypothetical protein
MKKPPVRLGLTMAGIESLPSLSEDQVHKLPQRFQARRFKPEYRLRGRVGF